MAYGMESNGDAFSSLLSDLDALLLRFVAEHPEAALNMYVQAHQPAFDGLVDHSTGVGVWDAQSKPGDSWREGLEAMNESKPVERNPNSRSARRRAGRGMYR